MSYWGLIHGSKAQIGVLEHALEHGIHEVLSTSRTGIGEHELLHTYELGDVNSTDTS